MLGDRSVEDLRQLAALNENTTDLAAALRWAADRIDELEAALGRLYRNHRLIMDKKPVRDLGETYADVERVLPDEEAT